MDAWPLLPEGFVVTTQVTPSYCRAPSSELKALLCTGGFLAPLLALGKRQVAGCDLDVHLRLDDKVQVYCGLTSLVVVRRINDENVDVSADESYSKQECAGDLFRSWAINQSDKSKFEKALNAYLDGVKVAHRQIGREGSVQSSWSRVTEPWIPFDREAELSYESAKDRAEARTFDRVEEARNKLNTIAQLRRSLPNRRDHWEAPPKRKDRLELDQLAVDSAGNLVLVEIKDASASRSSGVYYAPFQLLQYVWEWHGALDAVRKSLQKLLDARMALGLTLAHASPITGRGIRAAIGFGDDNRSNEVKCRYAKVLCVANAHLPPDVPRIETWAWVRGQPERLD